MKRTGCSFVQNTYAFPTHKVLLYFTDLHDGAVRTLPGVLTCGLFSHVLSTGLLSPIFVILQSDNKIGNSE